MPTPVVDVAACPIVGVSANLVYRGGMSIPPPTEQLTENQRECLRLVLTRHSSKEIAIQLGISESAVNKRLERAVQQLGASSRFAAARILAAAESGPAYDRLTSDPIDVPFEGQDTASPSPDEFRLVHRLLGIPPGGEWAGPRNPFGRAARLGIIAVLMLLVAMSFVALLSMGQTLTGMVHDQVALRR